MHAVLGSVVSSVTVREVGKETIAAEVCKLPPDAFHPFGIWECMRILDETDLVYFCSKLQRNYQ
jgi:hypothetical protein